MKTRILASLLPMFALLGSHAAHADPTTHEYTVRLHQLNVSRTRAEDDDTISVSMSAKVNGTMLPARTYSLGNHGHGVLWPELAYTFTAGDDDQVAVLVSVVNDHDPNDAASKAVGVLDTISNDAEQYVQKAYPLGPVWPAINSAIQSVNGWFAGGCDGAVAADAILGTGQTFDDWSENGTYYGGVQRHDGSSSPWYCGGTSLYFTQYSVTRDW
jgi:hypothetical protein